MKKKVILYLGEFDPPHLGQLYSAILALNYMNAYGFEKVMFVPVKTDVFGLSCVAPMNHMRSMLSLMLSPFDSEKFEIASFSINLNSYSNLIANIEKLQDEYNPLVLIEIEQANYLYKKRSYSQEADKIRFIITNKKGHFKDPNNPLLKEPNIFIKQYAYEEYIHPISLRKNSIKDEFLDDNVLKYMLQNNLYQRGNKHE